MICCPRFVQQRESQNQYRQIDQALNCRASVPTALLVQFHQVPARIVFQTDQPWY